MPVGTSGEIESRLRSAKPNTDDMRDAPSRVIVPILQERGATVRVVDPQGRKQADPLLPGVVWCDNALEAAVGADVLVTVTEWNEFRGLVTGFRYWAVGRKSDEADLVSARVALSA